MLAVARSLRQEDPQIELFFAGVKPFEKEYALQAGAEFIQLNVSGLKRSFTPAVFVSLARALSEAARLTGFIRQKGIDAVFAAGGYASFPAAAAAVLTRRPLYIHEQNTVPGLVNRVFAPFAAKVFLSFPVSRWKGEKFVLTGYPLREDILSGTREEALEFFQLETNRKTLLAFGGSQGSRKINQAVLELARQLEQNDLGARFQIIHATGPDRFEEVAQSLPEFKDLIYRNYPEIDRMGLAYAAADLVISRAGAGTIAELCACGKPAVLVPYPHAAADHQTKNARMLSDSGAALVIKDSELTGEKLFKLVNELFSNPQKLSAMAENARKLARVDAARIISSYIISESHED